MFLADGPSQAREMTLWTSLKITFSNLLSCFGQLVDILDLTLKFINYVFRFWYIISLLDQFWDEYPRLLCLLWSCVKSFYFTSFGGRLIKLSPAGCQKHVEFQETHLTWTYACRFLLLEALFFWQLFSLGCHGGIFTS